MAIQIDHQPDNNALRILATGQLTSDDYEKWVPELEKILKEYGKLKVLFEMRDFHGWDAGGLWEDIKFDAKHRNDVERLALVGERPWQKMMAPVCKPFTNAEVRAFTPAELSEAQRWIGYTPERAPVQ